ncbi:MAG TPA: cell division protein ZapA [Proteobacteria bacterium]|nr:cell division protein ZapA [Pseudomonadota bacterium]
MVAENRSVVVTIRGRKYPLRTDADTQRVQQVADLVNLKLDELDRQSSIKRYIGSNDIGLVILALLNLADECLVHKDKLDKIKERSEYLLAEIKGCSGL